MLEVLVAVALLGIALIAVIYQTQQSANAAHLLKSKFAANVLAGNIMAEIQTGLLKAPDSGGEQNGEELVLHQELTWKVRSQMRPEGSILEITVTVGQKDNPAVLATLKTYQP